MYVKTSVLKDGHTFTVHVLDPKVGSQEEEIDTKETCQEDGVEKADLEKPEKDGDLKNYVFPEIVIKLCAFYNCETHLRLVI